MSATMSDNGFEHAPPRYTRLGRETIDRIRDRLGDDGFRAFCIGTAMRYEERAGAKGDADGDAEKGRWYRQMVSHLNGTADDPRANRADYRPYVAHRWEP